MATKRPEYTWQNGYQQLAANHSPWKLDEEDEVETDDLSDDYVSPPSVDLVTSPVHNNLGINVLTSWPTIYDGTNSPHGIPSWWQPQEKVDVLICGAGPSGLGLAASLARQGLSFRIIDKADHPLIAGRADGVQPRFLETVAKWGLAPEVHEEGPLIDRTAIYKDGEKLLFNRTHQSDSRYRGLHVITQGQIERIYIRDLLRHKALVERSCSLDEFSVETVSNNDEAHSYPVRATIHNERTGENQVVQAKFLVGTDGGASRIRKAMKVPFDGVSTGIYWGIMDCIFETDYPHAWIFGSVLSSKHGCCVIIPREDGYIRLYTQLDVSHTGPISASRQARNPTFAESGGDVEVHSITPEEVLEHANRIFAPYVVKFAAPLSWFSIWRISERVARSFSSPDMRVHLAGDSAHIHSVMGAFGLNASILDVANLSWKIGLAAKGLAKTESLLSTYTSERRKHAVRIIQVSGEYLRFVCGASLEVLDLSDTESLAKTGSNSINGQGSQAQSSQRVALSATSPSPEVNGESKKGQAAEEHQRNKWEKEMDFLSSFFPTNGQFLLGLDCLYDESVAVAPNARPEESNEIPSKTKQRPPLRVKNGVRAPNPRICFSRDETGYLYDKLVGPDRFHLVIFASSLTGTEVRRQVGKFVQSLQNPSCFYHRFGGARIFHVVLVVKLLPFEFDDLYAAHPELVRPLQDIGASVLFDDRAPDEDAHTTWGVNHFKGAVAAIRPDLWLGMACYPEETDRLGRYFEGFLGAT